MLAGLWLGFAVAPSDFQQGEGYRIIFVHVPVSDLPLKELLQLELRQPFPLGQGSPPHRGPSRYLLKLALLAPRLHGY